MQAVCAPVPRVSDVPYHRVGTEFALPKSPSNWLMSVQFGSVAPGFDRAQVFHEPGCARSRHGFSQSKMLLKLCERIQR